MYPFGEYKFTFTHNTNIKGIWHEGTHRWTYELNENNLVTTLSKDGNEIEPKKHLPDWYNKQIELGQVKQIKYVETLSLLFCQQLERRFDLPREERKFRIWTTHRKDSTWGEGKQIELAETTKTYKQVADPIRDNINTINRGGKADICEVGEDDSDKEIFDKVVDGKGSPDLFGFDFSVGNGLPEFIEVKSERDGLSQQQRDWFAAAKDIFPAYTLTVEVPVN